MTAAIANFKSLCKGLEPVSHRFALRRERATTIFEFVEAYSIPGLRRRLSGFPAAMSGESRFIWSMSGIAAFGIVFLVFGGGTL